MSSPPAAPPMRPILIAGPTASGKSALAMALARRLGGVIVNADSQQVYREWRVLTARPSPEDEAAVPHRLYGHVGVAETYSVGRWLDEVRRVLAGTPPPRPSPTRGEGAQADGAAPVTPSWRFSPRAETGRSIAGARTGGRAAASTSEARDGPGAGVPSPLVGEGQGGGLRPIVVGGTGLYFKALTEGLAPVPDVAPEVRAEAEAELGRLGLGPFAARLAERDPATAAGIDLANPRRVLRAWEVLEATGTGLAAWQALTPPPVLPLAACEAVALVPPRAWLYARCEARLDAMLAEGALDEVRSVMALVAGFGLSRDAPGLKAVGAAELAAHLAGELTLAEAAARAKTATRRYAKRQLTWLRNQMGAWTLLDPSLPGAADRALALIAG